MHEAADSRQRVGLFFVGLALGYIVGRRIHHTALQDVEQYRETARDARRTAEALRWEMNARGGSNAKHSKVL